MSPLLISVAVFVAVAALIGAVAMMMRGGGESKVEDRLSLLTNIGQANTKESPGASVIASPLDAAPSFSDLLMSRFEKFSLLFQQADTTLTPPKFFMFSGLIGLGASLTTVVAGVNFAIAPLAFLCGASFPLLWLLMRRKRRLKAFAAQLPDALELLARALRSGHSLGAGFDLVRQEMMPPISVEFGRVFEENNLGIPITDAMNNMTDRIPNLDLKFFATAVILQRQTGGDLAEILDKIGALIRDRFRIWGQIQALTGEGRLSGVVLLALPVVLFLAVYRLNPDYVMVLFKDPLGKKMLAGAVFMQILGAYMIRKIVNIKV
ncbi:MAG: type II secretion system F family protein [Planctomycetaceae bacterium]|nr:type II secretion system F family protein [Planctomycetaceae bacterium]